jgi:stress response protein YsnF
MLQKKCSAWRKRANRYWQRQVDTGKSRIRRFVTEKPVEQQITLHEEHYEISRREVNDPQLDQDIDWKGRTIEVIETSEQPVVAKTARLAEEVVIRRRGSDRVETIRDPVRRQQLEVERVSDVKRAA